MERPAYTRVMSLLWVSLLALVLTTGQAFLAPFPKTGVSSGLVVRCSGPIRDPAPPPSACRRRITPGARRAGGLSMGMERDPERSGGMDRNGGEERPKAKKTPLVAAAPPQKPTLEEDLARSFSIMGQAFKDTVGTPVENYALLLGDICVLLGFRLSEDILLSPVPRLDIDAYPDVIEKGLGLYAEPALALGHVWTTMVDGAAFGVFWMAASMLASNEVVTMRATLDYRTSALLTFRNWLTASNLRLVVLLMTHMYLEQSIDLSMVQLELFGTLATMLAWRALYTSVMRLFI